MDKIYDPIQKRFLKLKSKKGLKTLKKYIKNFNGGFIRKLDPTIASGKMCFPYTKVKQHSNVTDCSLIALSLLGLPLEEVVRKFNRQKETEVGGLTEDEILKIINKYEKRKNTELSKINKYNVKMSFTFRSLIENENGFDKIFNKCMHDGIKNLFKYLQPMQMTIGNYGSGEGSGHAFIIARGTDTYNIICVQSSRSPALYEGLSDNQYIFSYEGDIEDIDSLISSDLYKYIATPFKQTALLELDLEELKKELKLDFKTIDLHREIDIGEIVTYLSEENKKGNEIFDATEQTSTEGTVTRSGPRTSTVSGQSIPDCVECEELSEITK